MIARAAKRALVWIDSRQAVVVGPGRRSPLAISIIRSDVPVHRRSMGHIRHQPSFRHGGGASQTAAEQRRLEHRERFLERVAARLDPVAVIDVIGPGDLPAHLSHRLRAVDEAHGSARAIAIRRARRLTSRQLVATWKALAGLPVRKVRERRHGWRTGRMG